MSLGPALEAAWDETEPEGLSQDHACPPLCLEQLVVRRAGLDTRLIPGFPLPIGSRPVALSMVLTPTWSPKASAVLLKPGWAQRLAPESNFYSLPAEAP